MRSCQDRRLTLPYRDYVRVARYAARSFRQRFLLVVSRRTEAGRGRFTNLRPNGPALAGSILALTGIRVRSYSQIMRYSSEHKARNHENILSVAARSFREHGGDSSGIGTVMKKVGLTKGGFYRHFKSKDDLFVEAVARAFDEMGRGMLEVARSAPEGQALRAIIERYLSARHANSPGMGCVVSALGQSSHESPRPCEHGLRRREKRIGSGCCHLCLVRREKKKWRSFSCCSPVWLGC